METYKINKSELMKSAWAIYRRFGCSTIFPQYNLSFSECLKRAWESEKKVKDMKIKEAKRKHFESQKQAVHYNWNLEAMHAHYSRPVGTYYGD